MSTSWDSFVAGHPCGHFLQSAAWGRLRASQGWQVAQALLPGPDGEAVSGAQLLLRRTPLGALAYVPRGPVCHPADPSWPLLVARMAQQAGRSAIALRLEPHWPDTAETRAWLSAQGLREVAPVQPPSTLRLDLTLGTEALLAGMKQKWRYNVRVAERDGVTVREGGAPDLSTFGRLMAETALRDAFHARPADYYAAVWQALGPLAHLYLAEWSGEVLAAILVVHFGATATYLYGASADRERQRMPNHLLQWVAIRRAQELGLASYDFWGIPDALGRAVSSGLALESVPLGHGELWGVWGFKRGFGGAVWRSVGAWDLPLAPRRYALARRLESWRSGGTTA
jgi:lipid II:glycine glycyltransferase (peptidoglycan interpeptide bridge formation enzyme)